jgi:hypothetical protein
MQETMGKGKKKVLISFLKVIKKVRQLRKLFSKQFYGNGL